MRRLPGSPPTAGVGCMSAASSTAESGSASCACTAVARCWMFATLITLGSRSASTQTDRGASRRSIRRATIRCSTRFFATVQELLAQMVVDRGVGAAPR